MINIRASAATKPNPDFKEQPRPAGQSNSQWLAKALGNRDPAGTVVLVGGVNLTHFRLRVAQSDARNDLMPSFWSHAALLRGASGKENWNLVEVSLEPAGGFGAVPERNGVQQGKFSAYSDPVKFPNIACLQVKLEKGAAGAGAELASALEKAVKTFHRQRGSVDIAGLIVEWLGYCWGVGDRSNPLVRGAGIPSAVLIEALFAILGVELTPGLASQSSCPEAIWQAAVWWQEFFDSQATITEKHPEGRYFIGQREAAVLDAEKPSSRKPGSARSRQASRGR